MLKLFRKIRQKLLNEGKLKSYLLYAVGEVLLIMISILLAFRVNTWNENRKNMHEEKQYIQRLYSELRSDSLKFSHELEKYKQNNRAISHFTTLLNSSSPKDSLLVIAAYDYFEYGWFTPYFPKSTSTFHDLESTGRLNIIQNTELRELLVKLYASYDEMSSQFRINQEWINPIDAKFTAESDMLKFAPVTEHLFKKQTREVEAAQLLEQKEIYIRNATAHYWINDYAIKSFDREIQEVANVLEILKKENQKNK